MQNSMMAWPELVAIDGTYKLNNRNLILWLWITEDSNGESEIVGSALITSEDEVTIRWMLETFKKVHSAASEKIKCFMTDV